MKKQLIYDLPTRAFHWLFACFFVTAISIAKLIDDESAIYSYHMLAGLLLGFTVIFRLIWGFAGSRFARFTSFAFHPRDLINYLRGILSGDKKRWVGHNPASSWAAITMMAFAAGLGITGYLMATGQKEEFEDIHELLANGFLILAILHIAGVALHAIRHKDGIGSTMLTGQKADLESENAIPSSQPAVAVLFITLVTAFSIHLYQNYDPGSQTLKLFGSTLQLGEAEGESENEREGEHKGEQKDEHKDEREDDES